MSKTVKVRIAVAVDPTGRWAAHGWVDAEDGFMMDLAVDSVEAGEARYFVEAELEAPEAQTIEAEVEKTAATVTDLQGLDPHTL